MSAGYFDVEGRLMPHGIMFHHFHNDGDQPYAQGSITSDQFKRIINYIGPEHVLPANLWLSKALNNNLEEKEVCITFDDALKCQIEVSYPILNEFGIEAFWFIYSSVFMGEKNNLEIYKYFYNVFFEDFASFYEIFREGLSQSNYGEGYTSNVRAFLGSNYLKEFDFYTDKEREFRYFRDRVLSKLEFETIMDNILHDYRIDKDQLTDNLWMNDGDISMLNSNEHIIGLHSYSHPTNMANLDIERQEDEYLKNRKHILSITGREPTTVSHPFGSYSRDTLDILTQLGVKVGFKSNSRVPHETKLEFPRMDHSIVLSEIGRR